MPETDDTPPRPRLVRDGHQFNIIAAMISGGLLLLAVVLIYYSKILNVNQDYSGLSAIVLAGFGLTVALLAILGIVYSVLGVQNREAALGLPEGSVRALLAFSLVLIFVCLTAFLFSRLDKKPCEKCGETLTGVTEAQVSDLRNNFIVAAQPARDNSGKALYEQIPDPRDASGRTMMDDTKHPLFNVTYYAKPNPEASDLAKQIFTTIATIFVSVVSFYFGSSVTSSAVGAGVRAAQAPPPTEVTRLGVPTPGPGAPAGSKPADQGSDQSPPSSTSTLVSNPSASSSTQTNQSASQPVPSNVALSDAPPTPSQAVKVVPAGKADAEICGDFNIGRAVVSGKTTPSEEKEKAQSPHPWLKPGDYDLSEDEPTQSGNS